MPYALACVANENLTLFLPQRNPGIPEWYIEFLSTIREKAASSKLAILAHGLIGHAHDLAQPNSTFSLSLPSQVEALAGVLHSLQEEFPSARFILVGHSIGGYINTKVAYFWVSATITDTF
jgi:pimeloyl-ACP methyl ester carboxylesterase